MYNILGKQNKESDEEFITSKRDFNKAVAKAEKLKSRGWREVTVVNSETMDIAFRVCGYIGTAKNGGNQGRYGDIHDRVYHLDDMEYEDGE